MVTDKYVSIVTGGDGGRWSWKEILIRVCFKEEPRKGGNLALQRLTT